MQDILDSIVQNLNSDSKKNSFCASIETKIENFDLSINDLGPIKFPLGAKSAKELTKAAKPAYFGWKDQTIYDKNIRHVWEISKNQIQISKQKFDQILKPILEKIKIKLNMPESSILSPHLHNLLIYEPGQFFSSHQDSEKLKGMVATLVILLPSKFEGGSLIIDQHGDTKKFNAKKNSEKITYIAFYADCHHQVEKVTSGYRVALTYNLTLENTALTQPETTNQKLSKALKNYFNFQTGQPKWLVYLLDHQYTQQSLNWNELKGADRQSLSQLKSVADQNNFQVHLALAEVHQIWDAYGSGSTRHQSYGDWDYDDSESDDDSEESPSETGELIDSDCSLNHWKDQNGPTLFSNDCTIDDRILCWNKSTDEFNPFKSEHEGFMGNYGNTIDRWYYRAAVVLWPKNTHYESLFEINPKYAIQMIQKLLLKNKADGLDAVQKILPRWQRYTLKDSEACQFAFNFATHIQDEKMGHTILKDKISLSLISKSCWPGFLLLIKTYGEEWCLLQLSDWKNQCSKKYFDADLIINDIVFIVDSLSTVSKKIRSWILDHQSKQIFLIDKKRSSDSYIELKPDNSNSFILIKDLAIGSIGNPVLFKEIINHILEYKYLYRPLTLAQLCQFIAPYSNKKNNSFQLLVVETKKRLFDAISKTRAKNDWSIQCQLNCKCALCNELNLFLKSSELQKMIWPIAKGQRQHVHNQIDRIELPVTHVTERRGSPHKLILTKSINVFKNETKFQLAAQEYLKKM